MYEALNAMRRNGIDNKQKILAHFEKITKTPMEVQKKYLLELLDENKDTEYGRKYGFSDIHSIEEYQRRVPITVYDDYSGYIDRMTNFGEENLICSKTGMVQQDLRNCRCAEKDPLFTENKRLFCKIQPRLSVGFIVQKSERKIFRRQMAESDTMQR